MGPIVDRSREHLGPADRAIIAGRKLLIEAARVVQDGAMPRGSGTSYYNVRASEKIFPRAKDWREVMLPEMHPSGEGIRAEAFVE